ncbi:glycosyltransferase family 2 protein [Galenea microaerophila]
MMHHLNYFLKMTRPTQASDRLVMTILCRNEVDIIEYNIRLHSALGVDAFLVMDNGSTDGTREKLEALKAEFELTVIDESGVYQQAKWMKQLAIQARDTLGASWVISNDADEFWIPQEAGKSLKDYLSHKDSVITIKRSNMLLTEAALAPSYHFTQAKYRVGYPICYDKQAELEDKSISMFFANISPKVIVNPKGFIKISGGNHRAKHIAKWLTARQEPGIRVYHYPIRSWAQFEANIQHRKQLLKKGNVRMGNHYRRWVKLLDEGKLYDEFKGFIINAQQKEALLRFGIMKEDNQPKKLFERFVQIKREQ